MFKKLSYSNSRINLLDCTLRDGGYYNNWNFSKNFIQNYINCIQTTGIKFIELGFRFHEKKKIKGLTAYTDQDLLNNLIFPESIKFGIMINAGDIITRNTLNLSILKKLVNSKNSKKLSFVRFACHQHEVFYLKKCFDYIRSLKLNIFVNLMQISEIDFRHLKKILYFLHKKKIQHLYLADSLGCLTPKRLERIIYFLKKNWKNEVGLHAHDNLKLALKNSQLAMKNNFKWIDSTITGMGRGPGNLRTEKILQKVPGYKISKKFRKVQNKFVKLQKNYKWGPNQYYKFAAQKKIHPTYIQRILADKRYVKNDYKKIFGSLSKIDSKKFNPFKLINSIYFDNSTKNKKGSWSPEKLLKDKKVLIIGPGKNLKKTINKIHNEIIHQNYFVISLNTIKTIKEKFIKLRVLCHPLRLISDKKNLLSLKSPVVIPLSSLSKTFKILMRKNLKRYYDYGLKINDNKDINISKNNCLLPYPLAIGYAVSIAISGKANSITFAGFDGYDKSDPEHDQTEEILAKFKKKYFNKKMISLTKTSYKNLTFK